MRWIEDKQNASVVGQVNNQTPTIGPTQDQKHVHVGSKEHLLKMWHTFTCVSNLSKKPISEYTEYTTKLSKKRT
jgi:hypothetical protein